MLRWCCLVTRRWSDDAVYNTLIVLSQVRRSALIAQPDAAAYRAWSTALVWRIAQLFHTQAGERIICPGYCEHY